MAGGSKYGNRKVEVDGIVFASKKEANRYLLLMDRQRRGEISGLRLQEPFRLIPAVWEDVPVQLKTKVVTRKRCVQRAVRYVADFVYEEDGRTVVEDVKGSARTRTREYLLKKKMMRALLGIAITEV